MKSLKEKVNEMVWASFQTGNLEGLKVLWPLRQDCWMIPEAPPPIFPL